MDRVKDLWDALDDVATIRKRELFFEFLTAVLAGILFGILFSPKSTMQIGSNNGNGNCGGDDNCKKRRKKCAKEKEETDSVIVIE